MKSEVADYLQALGSVMLVVRNAAGHEKSQAETDFLKREKIYNWFGTSDGAKANVLNHNVVHYPSTTGNN